VNRELEMENTFLKKPRGVLCQGASVSEKYTFIDAEYANNAGTRFFPSVVQMCRWLEVSKSLRDCGRCSRWTPPARRRDPAAARKIPNNSQAQPGDSTQVTGLKPHAVLTPVALMGAVMTVVPACRPLDAAQCSFAGS
jgi:hypothetical protein